MAQVHRLEQHTTKFDLSRIVTATQLKYRVWNASGENKKVISEVLRKYRVRMKDGDISDTTMPRPNSTNLEAEISSAYFGSERET
jgi:hypothetical protein